MNTQTHVLLACAILATPVVSGRVKKITTAMIAGAAIVGALLPDASLFVMWGIAKARGIPESVVWREWYYSDFWQQIGAVSNSLPLFLTVAIVAWWAGGRFRVIADSNSDLTPSRRRLNNGWPRLLLVLSNAALMHVICDFPLHHNDGHPHFWPFSNWIFSSPVSYWDPAHHGRIWSVIEMVLAAVLIAILWRRFKQVFVRTVLVLVASSYLIVIGYWWLAFS